MKKHIFAVQLFCFIICTTTSWAGSKVLNVQGKLTNSAGNALTGTFVVTFRLYANLADPLASAVWTESQSVKVSAGLFNVALGNFTSLDSIAFNQSYCLGMQVAGDPNELSPRQLLGASAFALGSLGDFNVAGSVTVSSNASVSGNISANTITVGGNDVGGYLVPVGAIMLFAANCPSGWNRFAALDNFFPMGAASYGATGGAATHTHSISTDGSHNHGGATGTASLMNREVVGAGYGQYGQKFVDDIGTYAYLKAVDDHNHGITADGAHNHGGATGAASSLPPYLGMIFCQKA
jgi:hypothetical protein